MEYLNYDRVKRRFLSVIGMPAEDFDEDRLFDMAEQYVVSHLTADITTLGSRELTLCENAAAAVAVYDYTLTRCLARRPVMSENGTVSAQREDYSIMSAASQLRREAFGQLAASSLADLTDFAFVGV